MGLIGIILAELHSKFLADLLLDVASFGGGRRVIIPCKSSIINVQRAIDLTCTLWIVGDVGGVDARVIRTARHAAAMRRFGRGEDVIVGSIPYGAGIRLSVEGMVTQPEDLHSAFVINASFFGRSIEPLFGRELLPLEVCTWNIKITLVLSAEACHCVKAQVR